MAEEGHSLYLMIINVITDVYLCGIDELSMLLVVS